MDERVVCDVSCSCDCDHWNWCCWRCRQSVQSGWGEVSKSNLIPRPRNFQRQNFSIIFRNKTKFQSNFRNKGKTIEFRSRSFSPGVFDVAESNDVTIIKIGLDFEKLQKKSCRKKATIQTPLAHLKLAQKRQSQKSSNKNVIT